MSGVPEPADPEVQYLLLRAAIMRPITERLLRAAGVQRGSRVLDVRCGRGEVTMLAAEMVGPSGAVVGIDRCAETAAVARRRAAAADLPQVTVVHAELEELADSDPYDLVIGRYVLFHEADPAYFVRQAAGFARAGGAVAFHECDMYRGFQSFPRIPLVQQVGDWVRSACLSALPNADVGARMASVFLAAGLPFPSLFAESVVGGGEDWIAYRWMADTVRMLLPQIVHGGMASEETIGIGSLETRLRNAVVRARSQVETEPQFCGWALVP